MSGSIAYAKSYYADTENSFISVSTASNDSWSYLGQMTVDQRKREQ